MLLFAYRWRQEMRSLISWAITIGVLTFAAFLVSMVFVDVEETTRLMGEWLAKAPPIIRGLLGGATSLFDPVRFVTGMVYSTITPGIVLVFVCLSVVGIYTREAGRGNLEFLLSLPVKRQHVVAGRILVFLLNLLLIHIVIYFAAAIGLASTGTEVDFVRSSHAVLNQYLLFSSIGGAAFLISLEWNDYSKVLMIALAFFFGLFSLNVSAETSKEFPELIRSFGQFVQGKETFTSDFLSLLNPFYYYDPSNILVEGIVLWWNYLVLAVSSVLFWIVGIRTYVRKQV